MAAAPWAGRAGAGGPGGGPTVGACSFCRRIVAFLSRYGLWSDHLQDRVAAAQPLVLGTETGGGFLRGVPGGLWGGRGCGA